MADVAHPVHRDERADVDVHGEHGTRGDRGAWSDLEPAAEPDGRVHDRDEPLRVAADASDDASFGRWASDAERDARVRSVVAQPVDATEDREAVDLASVKRGVVVDESEDVPSRAMRIDVL